MKPDLAYLYQINVSDGGLPKSAVPEAQVTFEGMQGDRQRNRKIHRGRDRAVCLYSFDLITALKTEGHEMLPGAAGENLTIAGMDWAVLKPGDMVAIGRDVRLEIMSYTAPCRQNGRWFLNGDYMRIAQQRHPGWSRLYARVLAEGLVCRGDAVTVDSSPIQQEARK